MLEASSCCDWVILLVLNWGAEWERRWTTRMGTSSSSELHIDDGNNDDVEGRAGIAMLGVLMVWDVSMLHGTCVLTPPSEMRGGEGK